MARVHARIPAAAASLVAQYGVVDAPSLVRTRGAAGAAPPGEAAVGAWLVELDAELLADGAPFLHVVFDQSAERFGRVRRRVHALIDQGAPHLGDLEHGAGFAVEQVDERPRCL